LLVSYINELAAVLGHCNVTVQLFADDMKMYAEMKTTFNADIFQYAPDRLAVWAGEWQLQISITKCFIMQVGKVPVDRTYFLNTHALAYTGWRFSVAVTRWSRSTQLLYIEPG